MKATRIVVAAAGMAAAGVLAVPQPAAAVPVTEVRAAAGVRPIAGAYIVTVKTGVDVPGLARAAAVNPRYTYDAAVDGFAADLTDSQLQALRRNPAVRSIEQDAWLDTALDDVQLGTPSWGIDRIDQRALPLDNSYSFTSTGAGVNAYIIDTGIDVTHPDFQGRASFDFNAIDKRNTDCNGHGTHVAGTVGSASYGVAKGVRLHAVKMLNCNGGGRTAATIKAIDWVTANAVKPAVANASWNWDFTNTLATALTNMMDSGVFLAASGGNTGANSCDRLPRGLAATFAVGATDINDVRASFSSTGTCVDVYAPGVSINSTQPGNTTALFSGTSMASPHAAGVAVLLKATFGDSTQGQVSAELIGRATGGVVQGNLVDTPNLLLFTDL